MSLSEGNIFSRLDSLPQLSIYDKFLYLKNEVKDVLAKEKYDSIQYNYFSMYVYYLIEKKTPLDEFKDLFKKIDKEDYTYVFSRLFEYNQPREEFDHYKAKSRNLSFSWDSIGAVFLDRSKNGFKIDEKNYPYMEALFSQLSTDNLENFNNSKFYSFLAYVLDDEESLLKFISACNKYDGLNLSKKSSYNALPLQILDYLAHKSYIDKKLTDEQRLSEINSVKKGFGILQERLLNFNDYIEEFLFEKNKTGTVLEPSMKAINLYCMVEFDFLPIMNNRVREFLKEIEQLNDYRDSVSQLNASNDFIKNSAKRKIHRLKSEGITNLSISMDIGLEKRSYYMSNDFIDTIDVNEELYNNIVGLKMLEKVIAEENFAHISIKKDIFTYIDKMKEDQDKLDEFDRFDLVSLENIQKGLKYITLDQNTRKSVSKKSGLKI